MRGPSFGGRVVQTNHTSSRFLIPWCWDSRVFFLRTVLKVFLVFRCWYSGILSHFWGALLCSETVGLFFPVVIQAVHQSIRQFRAPFHPALQIDGQVPGTKGLTYGRSIPHPPTISSCDFCSPSLPWNFLLRLDPPGGRGFWAAHFLVVRFWCEKF